MRKGCFESKTAFDALWRIEHNKATPKDVELVKTAIGEGWADYKFTFMRVETGHAGRYEADVLREALIH